VLKQTSHCYLCYSENVILILFKIRETLKERNYLNFFIPISKAFNVTSTYLDYLISPAPLLAVLFMLLTLKMLHLFLFTFTLFFSKIFASSLKILHGSPAGGIF